MDALDLDIARVRALHAIACGVTRLTWLAAAERFELAMRRHARALKYGFNPAQPRDEIGRWVDANGNVVESGRVRLAGDIPTGDSPETTADVGGAYGCLKKDRETARTSYHGWRSPLRGRLVDPRIPC